MGKKKKITPVKERAAQAKANAEKLADTFRALGLTVEIYEYNPTWQVNAKEKPEVISVVELPELIDSEGELLSFCFSHNSGRIIKNNV
jgi:hypothetical protein